MRARFFHLRAPGRVAGPAAVRTAARAAAVPTGRTVVAAALAAVAVLAGCASKSPNPAPTNSPPSSPATQRQISFSWTSAQRWHYQATLDVPADLRIELGRDSTGAPSGQARLSFHVSGPATAAQPRSIFPVVPAGQKPGPPLNLGSGLLVLPLPSTLTRIGNLGSNCSWDYIGMLCTVPTTSQGYSGATALSTDQETVDQAVSLGNAAHTLYVVQLGDNADCWYTVDLTTGAAARPRPADPTCGDATVSVTSHTP